MNKNTALLIGAFAGAGLGWFVGSVIAEIILIRESQEEDDGYDGSDEFPDGEEAPVHILDKKAKMPKRNKSYNTYFKDRPELAELVRKYNGEDTESAVVMGGDESSPEPEGVLDGEDSEDENFETSEDADRPDGIYIIPLSTFANNEDYDSITLSYYEDEVVTDEHNNPIVHPEQLIGDEALVSFGELSEDEDVVYVQNDFKKCMYEVVRAGRPYTMTAEMYISRKKNLKNEVENDAEEVDPD
jgi:hypothetical protein